MALLSSHVLLRTHSLLLLTTAYFLLTSPLAILNSPIIAILGGSMHIHAAQFQPSLNPLTSTPLALDSETIELLGAVALLISVYATTQLVFAGSLLIPSSLSNPSSSTGGAAAAAPRRNSRALGEDLHTLLSSQSTHITLSTTHIFTNGALIAWIYLFHSERNLLSGLSDSSSVSKPGSLGSILGNQVVFSAGLMQMLFHGYLWTVVSEERRAVLGRVQGMRRDEDED